MEKLAPSSHVIAVEHVTIPSANAFEEVRGKLEDLVPPLGDEIFRAMRAGDGERAMRVMTAAAAVSIFGIREHGGMLAVITGVRRRAVQYDMGNPLTASKMTRLRISASLYAPVRVLLREDNGEVAFEYDRPASLFGQFGNAEVDAVAEQLDRDLRSSLEAAAS